MTTGQLLKHITNACGAACKGFVTGDWGLPEAVKLEDLSPEQMLPPAEMMPGIESVEIARKLLAEDKALALRMIDQAGEDDLANRQIVAPWDSGKSDPLVGSCCRRSGISTDTRLSCSTT